MDTLTSCNRRIVEQFVDLFYHQHKVREAFEAHVSSEHYIQHNPGLPDGREVHLPFLPSRSLLFIVPLAQVGGVHYILLFASCFSLAMM